MKVVLFCGGLGMHMRERLVPYPCDGYWARMDTFEENQDFENVFGRGSAPWAVWNHQHENKK
jgi:glucose-1-phosphate cytidylyltransferase